MSERRASARVLSESPSQTAGPYVHIGCAPSVAGVEGVYPADLGAAELEPAAAGPRIVIEGLVYDGYGAPVRDAMIEFWQADARGLYPGDDPRGRADAALTGWGRRMADLQSGLWRLETVKPGRAPSPDGSLMAPHIALWIAARGINIGLLTRLYFSDEADANAEDPILARIDPPDRAQTLIAQAQGDGVYRFDIRLQGERETVFFDV